MIQRDTAFVRDKTLAAGPVALTPAASALPLTGCVRRELNEDFVSRKALAAGASDAGFLALSNGDSKTTVASVFPLIGVTDRIVAVIGELSQ